MMSDEGFLGYGHDLFLCYSGCKDVFDFEMRMKFDKNALHYTGYYLLWFTLHVN